jgi:hypothetical protein
MKIATIIINCMASDENKVSRENEHATVLFLDDGPTHRGN